MNNKTKKIINFGSMMQHSKNENLVSKNFYAATKNAFEMISNYYANINNKTKFYNIKFYREITLLHLSLYSFVWILDLFNPALLFSAYCCNSMMLLLIARLTSTTFPVLAV